MTAIRRILAASARHALFEALQERFKTVRRFKPKASRADSVEMFLLASGYKGAE